MKCPSDEAQSTRGLRVDLVTLFIPGQVVADGDTEVVVTCDPWNDLIVHTVCMVEWPLLLRDGHDGTLRDVKVHLPFGGPGMQGVQIALEGGGVVSGVYLSVYDAIISKEPDIGADVCHDVDIYQEEYGPQDRALRDPRHHIRRRGVCSVHHDLLLAVVEECTDPLICVI